MLSSPTSPSLESPLRLLRESRRLQLYRSPARLNFRIDSTNITVMPNSITEFAQPYPFTVHPSECLLSGMPPIFNFKEQVRWSSGAGLDGTEKTLEWKGWVELVDEREDLRRSAMFMGFFGDLFRNGFERLPKAEQPAPGWLPTLHFAVEFKCTSDHPRSSRRYLSSLCSFF